MFNRNRAEVFCEFVSWIADYVDDWDPMSHYSWVGLVNKWNSLNKGFDMWVDKMEIMYIRRVLGCI